MKYIIYYIITFLFTIIGMVSFSFYLDPEIEVFSLSGIGYFILAYTLILKPSLDYWFNKVQEIFNKN